MGTFFVILLQLALCGFIAYIGDLLGRRLGKKRLSVFGLRPKHTAILLTVITGIVIAGGTFLAAMATVPGFRQAVIQGERLAEQNRGLMAANQAAQAQSTRIQAENGKLVGANAALKTTNDTLVGQNQQLTGTNETLKKTNQELEARNGELRTSNGELLQVKARLMGEKQQLAVQVDSLRSKKYIFRRNQALCKTWVVPKNPGRSNLERALDALIFNATHEAKDAKPENGHPAVYLVKAERYKGSPDERSIRSFVIQQLLKIRDTPLVLRLAADENVVAGHAVPARLEWGANAVVFHKGDLIAERPVDGASTPGVVVLQLQYFFDTQLREQAAKRHVMFSGELASEEPGYWDRIWDLCKRIKEMDRSVNLVARASQDIRRAGPLNLDVQAQPVGSTAGL